MYSLLAVSWMLWADWRDYFSSAIGSNPFPRPKGGEAVLFWGGKLVWTCTTRLSRPSWKRYAASTGLRTTRCPPSGPRWHRTSAG